MLLGVGLRELAARHWMALPAPITYVAVISTGGFRSPALPLLAAAAPLLGLAPFRPDKLTLIRRANLLFLAALALIELFSDAEPVDRTAIAISCVFGIAVAFVLCDRARSVFDRALEDARRSQERAVATARAREEMLFATSSAFAHELKNPLAAIQGLATLAQRRASRSDQDRAEVDALVEDVRTASTLVRELLDFTRPVGPKSLQRVRVSELLRGAGFADVGGAVDAAIVVEPAKAERAIALAARGAQAIRVDEEAPGRVSLTMEGFSAAGRPSEIAAACALLEQLGAHLERGEVGRARIVFGERAHEGSKALVVKRLDPVVLFQRVTALMSFGLFSIYATIASGGALRGFLALAGVAITATIMLRDRRTAARNLRTVFARSLSIMMCGGVVLLGGLGSPFAVALPLVTAISTAFIPTRRDIFTVVAIISATAAAMIAMELLAPELAVFVPLDRGIPGAPHIAGTLAMSLILMRGMTAGGQLSVAVRSAIEEARAVEDAAREEHVAEYDERSRSIELLAARLAMEVRGPGERIERRARALFDRAEKIERERFGVLIAETVRMLSLLGGYAALGNEALAAETLHIRGLADEIAAGEQGLAELREVRIVNDIDGGVAAPLDRTRLRHALGNLVRNAVEATSAGGRVRVACELDGGALHIHVDDDGPGLTAETLAALSTPGFTTKSQGTGLGLTVARRLVAPHGGTISLENRASGGCRATIALRVRP